MPIADFFVSEKNPFLHRERPFQTHTIYIYISFADIIDCTATMMSSLVRAAVIMRDPYRNA